MKRFLSRRPSPSMFVAVIALVAALSGSAIAAGVLTTNTFKNRAVRGPVTYVTSQVNVPNTSGPPLSGQGVHLDAKCPSGTHVLGGGIHVSDQSSMNVNDSYATSAGWAGTVFNLNPQTQKATITAICARVRHTRGSVPPAT
jgi:hypothetical protein